MELHIKLCSLSQKNLYEPLFKMFILFIFEDFAWSYSSNSDYNDCKPNNSSLQCGDGLRIRQPTRCLNKVDNTTHPKEACEGSTEEDQECHIVCPGKNYFLIVDEICQNIYVYIYKDKK